MVTKQDIIDIARSWVGTPFAHQGRKKQVGVDCIGLIVGVAKELNIFIHDVPIHLIDRRDYSAQPDGLDLIRTLQKYLIPISDFAEMQMADIACMNMRGHPQHVGFISDYGIIHSYAPAKKVVETSLDDKWLLRVNSIYRFAKVA